MSTQPRQASTGDDVVQVPPPSHFAERADRGDPEWLEDAIEAYLDLTLGPKQREICRSVVTNERTAVVGANGTGKTYITAAIALAWQTVRYPAITFGTSGTGKKLYRTLCRPIDRLHDQALGGAGLPGEFKRQPPRIDYDDPEHYFEAATPKDAGELEGAHSAYTLAIVEETDKADVTSATIDAMRSLIPDYDTSRMLAVGNPPESETNVFADLVDERSNWHTVRVSSFDSYNVLVETDELDGEIIDGMATISALRNDWQGYHDEEWPGVERARGWSDPDSTNFRDDLDERWYRRRAGVMPPDSSQTWRPFDVATIRGAYTRDLDRIRETPSALGIDVARSGDRTVMVGLRDARLEVYYSEQGSNHDAQEATLSKQIEGWPHPEIAVDAVGEGSGLADGLDTRFPNVVRFGASKTARDDTTYRDTWAEGLYHLGQLLQQGSIDDAHLREELLTAAHVVEFDETHLDSRGGTVIEATPKSDIIDELGRSPDHLDAALMCVWVARTDSSQNRASPTFSW